MPEEMDLIKLNSIKSYIKEVLKMRVSDTAADNLRARINQTTKDIIGKAQKTAKEDNRDTLMPRDMDPAIEQILGTRVLTLPDIFEGVKKLNPVQLGELSKLITAYTEELKKS